MTTESYYLERMKDAVEHNQRAKAIITYASWQGYRSGLSFCKSKGDPFIADAMDREYRKMLVRL